MILLDTSFLVALFNEGDALHDKAKKIQKNLKGEDLGLCEYVVLELSTILAMRCSLTIAKKTLDSLLSSKEIHFIPSLGIFSLAYSKMFSQKEYKLSFVDCSLLAILESGIAKKIITFDQELEREASILFG